ncbi:pyrrolidone-carboxylate peptidase [Arsukibacterium sp. MJ3]|jgi:pyroglutamyl-peptidase|uniref:pyroglutamyl-peptidase I family protein n=1 Tax=Arsukibacterium sp. MJ3 TaxID=1632859 RepID=UPI000627224E|nr:pyrrolidone-carboxylate peptidase [Arsukibacterium sp. MJ3]KKO49878.1 pyrrolidone-carboxylate peptidase [Arsukibacterium sp. MJ3]
MVNVLITGFAPLAGETLNTSWQVANALNGWQCDGEVTITALQLPCVFKQSLLALEKAITQLKPVLVIMLGQAACSGLKLEKIASNYINAGTADSCGQQPRDSLTASHGPAAYFSNLPINAILAALHLQHIPAQLSLSAGCDVGNHSFYGLMHLIKNHYASIKGGFINLPYLPLQVIGKIDVASMALDTQINALKICIEISLLQQTDQLIA